MTMTPIATYDRFAVVAVPFPFTDAKREKRRPALILSSETEFNGRIGHSVMAMITSAKNDPWPLDTEIQELPAAGLTAPSRVRMKLFTLDHRFIDRTIGRLSNADRIRVIRALRRLLAR
jgi:mRNA interferase MazF